MQLTQCDKYSAWEEHLRCKEAIRHFKAKNSYNEQSLELETYQQRSKNLNILNIHDCPNPATKLEKQHRSKWIHEVCPQKVSQPNMLKTSNSRPVADSGLSVRGRYSSEGPDGLGIITKHHQPSQWFSSAEKSSLWGGKPIEKHILLSFLQLHLLHTLRSTSLISNVYLTLKWFKCFYLAIKRCTHVSTSFCFCPKCTFQLSAWLSFTLGSMGHHLRSTWQSVTTGNPSSRDTLLVASAQPPASWSSRSMQIATMIKHPILSRPFAQH